MHDPAPKGMAHCPHSSIRAPPGPAHFPTVRRTVGTGRDADRPDVLFSSLMAHRVQLSRRLDKRKTPCFPARRLRGAHDWIRTSGLQSRSLSLYPAELRAQICMRTAKAVVNLLKNSSQRRDFSFPPNPQSSINTDFLGMSQLERSESSESVTLSS